MPRTPPVNVRRSMQIRPGTGLVALTLALLASAQAAPACTDRLNGDLEAALVAESSARWLREDEVLRRETDLELARLGVTASIGLRPSAGVGHDLDPEEGVDALDLIGYQVDAALGYRYDDVAIARAHASLVAARGRLVAQRRADVLDALVAISRLRVAERVEAVAEVELALALGGLAQAEATALQRAADPDYGPLPGSPAAEDPGPPAEPVFLREARLQARRAELDLEDAKAGSSAQLAALAALGVTPPGRTEEDCLLAPLELPAHRADELLARMALQAALQLAEAQRSRAMWAPVRDLKLEAHYQEEGARATASAGIANGRPNAGVALRWRPTGKDAWRIQLSANLRLDESMGAAVLEAEAAAFKAREALSAFDTAQVAAIAGARRALARAWAEVEVLDEALQLAIIKRDDPAEARYLPRNVQAVARALDARERGLQGYLKTYAAYLGVFEAQWPAP